MKRLGQQRFGGGTTLLPDSCAWAAVAGVVRAQRGNTGGVSLAAVKPAPPHEALGTGVVKAARVGVVSIPDGVRFAGARRSGGGSGFMPDRWGRLPSRHLALLRFAP